MKGDAVSGMQDVRRYRADQLARTHYTRLQAPVARHVQRKLGRAAEQIPDQELEASYNMAWDALMRQVAQGRAPDCIEGWLRVVTYRQAVGYLRRCRSHRELPLVEDNIFETVDDPYELANSREIVRGSLTRIQRRFGERGARIVAYLWLGDLTRAMAAERVGISKKCLEHMLYGTPRTTGLRDELAAPWSGTTRALASRYRRPDPCEAPVTSVERAVRAAALAVAGRLG